MTGTNATTGSAGLTEAEIIDRMRRCASAEEYFDLLDVPYDVRVLDVNRLHILRRFALEIESLPSTVAAVPPAQAVTRYREALRRSYQAFVTGTALDHRLFKVLRDRAPQAFVPAPDVRVEAHVDVRGTSR